MVIMMRLVRGGNAVAVIVDDATGSYSKGNAEC